MSRVEYAQHRGVSREAVRKAIRDGRIREEARGIQWVAADAAWAAADREQPVEPAGRRARAPAPARQQAVVAQDPFGLIIQMPVGLTPASARAMHEYVKTKLSDLEYARETGRLLDAELLLDALSTRLRAAFDRLHGIPDRVSDKLASLYEGGNPDEVRRILREEVETVSAELEATSSVPAAVAREQVS